jgi:AcrR family transcriptional regulator
MPSASTAAHQRAPRKDAAENRAAILDAAAVLLNHDPDSSLEAIASEAGLSRRALYGHFSTRDELLDELLSRGSARVTAAVGSIDVADARVAIALIGARLWSEVEHVRVMAQLAVRGPHQAAIAETLEPVRRLLREAVARGIADGTLRADIAADTLARLIESAAVSVLDEAVRFPLSRAEGHRLVMLSALGAAGLSWREADAVIGSAPQLRIAELPAAEPPFPGTVEGHVDGLDDRLDDRTANERNPL